MSDEAQEVDEEARALEARVTAGTLAREVLELLAGVDHRPSQRALGRLPLVLTAPPAELALEPGAPAHAVSWARWALGLEPHGRALAVEVALAACELVRPALESEVEGAAWELSGLHTGPAGAVVIPRSLAASLVPLSAVGSRVIDATRRWLARPSSEAAGAVASAWPELIGRRAVAELVGELTGVDGAAIWALRSLAHAVSDSAPSAATADALASAESVLGSHAAVAEAARGVLVARLI